MSSYADLDSLKAWMSAGDDSAVTFTGDDEATLQLLLDAATAFIAQYTGRSFAAEVAATKYFYPTATGYLDLTPDIRTVTSVASDTNGDLGFATTLVADTDYYLLPLNPRPDAGIYNRLQIAPTSSKAFSPSRRVRVVGDWGYVVNGAAPANIQTACVLQAARWWARKGAPLGMLQNTDLGTFARLAKGDPDVAALLDPYKAASISAWLLV